MSFIGKNEDSGLDDSTELPISKDAVIEFKTSEEKNSNVASSKGMFLLFQDYIPSQFHRYFEDCLNIHHFVKSLS